MIDTKSFYDTLLNKGMDFFAGVPDSLLQNLCACITENSPSSHNIIAANEGNAVAIASGYHVSTGKYGVVYMQNSGLGNTVNPLLSLTDEDVYNIPMLLIIGWRGEPGTKDEPQHVTQGRLTIPLLEAMEIEFLFLDEEYKQQIDACYDYMRQSGKPIALIVKKGTFDSYEKSEPVKRHKILREKALECIIENISPDDLLVSTTGKTSREIYEIREKRGEGHQRDFLTVGSMGHTASIALGMSLGTNKNVYCIDGDGSFIMHMGGIGIAAKNARENFKYILINNGAHESVGGQPTIGFDMDIPKILLAAGFKKVMTASSSEEIKDGITQLHSLALGAFVINVDQGSRTDLGRPTISPKQNKLDMMQIFAGK